ncbi:universal stress protein [Haliscomenobacter hydrossis]|uniref:UspA domain-containing protein n=1 Tax=Haliscomenobacter hydrossis (strain ATCC 27775 / DSM 1100 / LMG 10767 / O) TaxID=760192 RepID=F4L483_HALH1|nr:universal stress protein [Haliscomenobacter hydrossis]AEE50781.1 UspA domain-containing protein [Haliscomenobacter hydrossis DSM 1100]
MSQIKKILFPTDFSPTAQNAFKHCLILADYYEAKVEVVHAVFPEYAALDMPVVSMTTTREKAEAARAVLGSFVELGMTQTQEFYTFKNLPTVEQMVEIGVPIGTILKLADERHIDLIMMGTKGEHNTMERAFGSVSTGVLEHAICPVMVIPEFAHWKPTHIVAYASDLSESDPYHFWKAADILTPFHPLVHVVNIHKGEAHDEVAIDELKKIFSNNTPAVQISFHQEKHDSITAGIETFVDNYGVDLLMMYSPHRSWIERLFHHSQTRDLAFTTRIPLLVIKS